MKISKSVSMSALVCFVALCLLASDAMAQRGGGRGGQRGGQRGGAAGFGGGSQALLRRDDVQKELELSDSQIEQLEGLSQGRRGGGEGGRDMRAEMEGLSDEERRERFQQLREERESEMTAQINDILLPHQVQRLEQLSVQFSAQRGTRGIVSGSLAEQLGITEDQKSQIEEKAEELQRDLNEKIAKLRKEMQDELLKELTSDQRDKLKELTGDSFEFAQQQRGGGQSAFGANRQRGGQGGRGGEGARGGQGGRGGDGARGGRGGRGGDGARGERGGERGDDGTDF